jgi:glycosyltransferase involved in cell wall biosynthesis
MACRLAIVSSHPIQYNAPAFKSLASDPRLQVKVFYGWEGPGNIADPEFGHPVRWDVPLLEGYEHVFVANKSRDPGTHRFGGLKNPTMVREIRNWNPDVILIYGWSFNAHLRVMRAFRGNVPILFRGDSTVLGNRSPFKQYARRLFLRWVLGHVDIALYAGKHNRDYYLDAGLDESQLVWAPHAVDNNRFTDQSGRNEARAAEWRKMLAIDEEDVVFLFAGKLVPWKDPMTLMTAFLRFAREPAGRHAHLVFVGEGELRQALERKAAGRRDIHFLGFQNQSAMPAMYRLSNLVVLPSLRETWGLAVNEAMACSRAVIVSHLVGCAPDLVEPGETGEVFRCGDSDELATILTQMSDAPTTSVRMGLAARRLIDGWSVNAYARIVADAASAIATRRDRNSSKLRP